jgi:hypothetical protein
MINVLIAMAVKNTSVFCEYITLSWFDLLLFIVRDKTI